MARNGVIDRNLGWQEILRELAELKKIGVKVGITEGNHISESGANIAEYAAYNEEGTEDIPSRPFIRSWVDNNREQINKVMDSAFNSVVSGKRTAEDAMKRIGEFGASGIKKNIVSGGFEPNNPSTVKRKGSSKPLIDTGTMRNAVSYEVVKKK